MKSHKNNHNHKLSKFCVQWKHNKKSLKVDLIWTKSTLFQKIKLIYRNYPYKNLLLSISIECNNHHTKYFFSLDHHKNQLLHFNSKLSIHPPNWGQMNKLWIPTHTFIFVIMLLDPEETYNMRVLSIQIHSNLVPLI